MFRMAVKDKEETCSAEGEKRWRKVWGGKPWLFQILLTGDRGWGSPWLSFETCLRGSSVPYIKASSDNLQPSLKTVSQGRGKVPYYLLSFLLFVLPGKLKSTSTSVFCIVCIVKTFGKLIWFLLQMSFPDSMEDIQKQASLQIGHQKIVSQSQVLCLLLKATLENVYSSSLQLVGLTVSSASGLSTEVRDS